MREMSNGYWVDTTANDAAEPTRDTILAHVGWSRGVLLVRSAIMCSIALFAAHVDGMSGVLLLGLVHGVLALSGKSFRAALPLAIGILSIETLIEVPGMLAQGAGVFLGYAMVRGLLLWVVGRGARAALKLGRDA